MSAVIENPGEVFSRPAAEARIHDFEHFTLWTETPDRPQFRSRMVFGERNGAFRITVFTNFESTPKPLYVGMSPTVFDEFMRRFENVVAGPAGKKDKIENLDRSPNAERTPNPDDVAKIVRNTLHFGKDNDGVCWIGIEQPNVKNIRFKILSSTWHHFFKEDGSRITPEEGSSAEAASVIRGLRVAMAPYIARLRPPFDKNAAKGGAGGGKTTFAASPGVDEDITY